ncbi:hypothetical protein EXY25_11895 [Corallincola spongiicola]|uniref:ABC-type transport auxiliary lipoprotein component domain-containing protein n=2 Tax=Corallincola spongiicola TaxID=2520508 RepID=A0ABY1WPP2_9GAMM|nr:hypothetical protein EXY25_11895 [Corallincola spongiicola]
MENKTGSMHPGVIMRNRLSWITALIIFAGTSLSGCSSSGPTDYYLLSADAKSATVPAPDLALTVGPVYLADYLQRQGMVARSTAVNYQISDHDLWASQLDNDINIVLLKNLQTITGSSQLRPFGVIGVAPQPSLRIKIDRLDSDSQGIARLEGSWQLLSSDHKELRYETFALNTSAESTTESQVNAISQLISELSEAIAKALTTDPS